MINRSLIRLKVVQLLYSYLLTQSDFSIREAPVNPSRDLKYGYGLYMDLLLLLLELSGIDTTDGKNVPLFEKRTKVEYIEKNQLAQALAKDPAIREAIALRRGNPGQFAPIVNEILDIIPELPAYKTYAKARRSRDKEKKVPTMAEDVALWKSVITNVMEKNPDFQTTARTADPDNFTVTGFKYATDSLLATLNAYGNNRELFMQASDDLKASLEQANLLYLALLDLAVELTDARRQQLELAREKYNPTDEDLHPNMRFVDNKFIAMLRENKGYRDFKEADENIMWERDLALQKSLLALITASKPYETYMSLRGETTLEQDAEIWRELFKDVILPSDDLAEALESKSIYWNDDLCVTSTFVLKTIRRFGQGKEEGEEISLLPKYKDGDNGEDARFGPDLFLAAAVNYEKYRNLVEQFVDKQRWEADRLAFMDIVIMVTAIAEIVKYPAIPLAVSLNEYIEIANAYSTPRSGQFINGILYSVTKHLKEQGAIDKN